MRLRGYKAQHVFHTHAPAAAAATTKIKGRAADDDDGDAADVSSFAPTRRRSLLPATPLRNLDAAAIGQHGFVECPSLLPPDVVGRLAATNMKSAIAISNAFQKDVRARPLFDEVAQCIRASPRVRAAMVAMFGVPRFEVSHLKVLVTKAGQRPQCPHADDHCNRELFGVVHLLPDQAQTEAVPFRGSAPYPSGVMAECESCGTWRTVPDALARRRTHLLAPFTCVAVGGACRPQEARDRRRLGAVDVASAAALAGPCYDREKLIESELDGDPFAHDLAECFGDLLWRPGKVLGALRTVGSPPGVGDGILALPTLVHRGPGAYDSDAHRKVLFFTLRPLFPGVKAGAGHVGVYDADAQIHAGWLLHRMQAAVKESGEVEKAWAEHGVQLAMFGEGEIVRWKEGEL